MKEWQPEISEVIDRRTGLVGKLVWEGRTNREGDALVDIHFRGLKPGRGWTYSAPYSAVRDGIGMLFELPPQKSPVK